VDFLDRLQEETHEPGLKAAACAASSPAEILEYRQVLRLTGLGY
jgi:hypothetical protein